MTVDVFIPTYQSRWLADAIRSALDQTWTDLRVVVVDDGDGAAKSVCAQFKDPRLSYVRNPTNLGMVANWNRCLELARSEFVALLHDDDTWEPDFLRKQVGALQRMPEAALACCAAAIIDESSTRTGTHRPWRRNLVFAPGELQAALLTGNRILCPTVLLRRSHVGGHRFDPRFRHATDWRLWLELGRRFPAIYTNDVQANYRVSSSSLTGRSESHSGRQRRIEEARLIILDAARDGSPVARRRARRGLSRMGAMAAMNDAREGLPVKSYGSMFTGIHTSAWVLAALPAALALRGLRRFSQRMHERLRMRIP